MHKGKLIENLIESKGRIDELLRDGDNEAVIHFLAGLRNIEVTREILIKTEIGKYLTRLSRNSDNRKVRKIAEEVVNNWKIEISQSDKIKKEASEKTLKPVKKEYKTFGDLSVVPKKRVDIEELEPAQKLRLVKDENGNETYVPVKVKRVDAFSKNQREQPIYMPPEKKEFPERYPEDDGLQFRPHDVPYRNQVRRVLYSGLGRLTKIDGRTVMDLVNQIEDLTWKRFGSTKNRDYYNHIRNINTCLRDFRNTEFNEKILKGTYKPDYIANMPPTKMVSFARQEEAELRKEAFFKDIEGAKEDKPTTDMFKCGKCKKRKCRYYQKQIRSADEPMTTFVTCTYCYHSWKFC